MQNTHIFLVILATVIMIVFTEYQKLRNITWILLIGCVTYILLTIIPERPLPTSYESDELNKIDSSNITEIANYLIKNNAIDDSIARESDIIDQTNFDEFDVVDEIQNLDILTLVIATDIVKKTPIGVSGLFLNDINALFCFTAVDNILKYNKIIHTWEHDGQVYFKSFIGVEESSYWRCWSRITVRPEMAGDWQVIVTDTLGNYLDSIEFSIIPINE